MTGGLKQLLPAVASVVDLNVTRDDLGKVLEQLRTMPVLGVDQQVMCIEKRIGNISDLCCKMYTVLGRHSQVIQWRFPLGNRGMRSPFAVDCDVRRI